MSLTLQQDVKAGGMNQGDLYAVVSNLVDAVNALIANHNTLIAKLNADAGVTDTNYAASTASTVKLTKG
jgi:arsenate reductase-like glutaredoxin family protein